MSELYERLKKKRIDLQLSQENVASFLGVRRSAIIAIENNQRKISSGELAKYSELFAETMDGLWYGNESMDHNQKLLKKIQSLGPEDRKEIENLIDFKMSRQREK